MNKRIIYSVACAGCLALSTAVTVVSATTNNSSGSASKEASGRALIATTNELVPTNKFESKNETVYAITKASGEVTKSFVGSEINDSGEPLPVTMSVRYYLDGEAISPEDLVGKSGHVRMVYRFESTKGSGDKVVPFVTVTGMNLDAGKFTNIKVEHGKIIRQASESTTVVGYTFAGMGRDLGTDILNDSFSIEADVNDYTMSEAYSIAMNEPIADIDTSRFGSVEEMVNSVNELAAGLDQLIAGSSELSNGLDAGLAGAQKLQSGIDELKSGVAVLSNGSHTLSSGAGTLATGAHQLADGLGQVVEFDSKVVGKIDAASQAVTARVNEFNSEYAEIIAELSDEYPELATKLSEVTGQITSYYDTAHSAVTTYTGNIEKLYDGAYRLASGADALADGANKLDSGIDTLAAGVSALDGGSDQLVDGMAKLASGSHTLSGGLSAFKTNGIDRLVDFANNDLAGFMSNLRATVSAARSYKHYTNKSAESVKFIFKTLAK